MTKKILSILSLFLLVVGLVASSLLVYRQVNLRSKAAGGGAGLTLSSNAPAAGVNPGGTFDVTVILTNSVTANKITAASVALTYPSDKLTLTSVTPGPYFKTGYVLNSTEMLSLGTTCTQKSDCGTTATGVNCTSNLCVNSAFTGNTAGSVKFFLGVPCDISGARCYPQTSASGTIATVKFTVKTTATPGAVSIGFDAANNSVAALDATGAAIATNVLDTATLSPVAVTISAVCPAGQTICNGVCKNLISDPANCGTCSHTCATGQSCTNGACTNPASPTLTFGFKLLQNNNTVARTADVLLKGGGQTLAFTNIALTGTSGVFRPTTPITLTGVTVGTSYDVLVKSPGYLRKKLGTITITSGTNTGSTTWNNILPLAGDLDGNNILNAMDVGNILGLYNAISVPVTAATKVYDLDGNGVINALDVANTLANYTAISVSGDN